MNRKVVITHHEDGTMTTEFSGYVGRACFVDSEKIEAQLKKMGMDIKSKTVRPKREEVVIDGIAIERG